MSRRVYTIQVVPETTRLEDAERLAQALEAWKQEIPPLFSTISASSLVPPLQRQSHVLQMAYDHAVLHANRSFLLTNFTDLSKRPAISDEKLQRQVKACVEAATRIVRTVNDLSEESPLSWAFWFTHYCTFCAVFVIYIHIIRLGKVPFEQQSESSPVALLEVTERCQRNLAHATRQNSPSWRYSIILEELRLEVHRQMHSATSPISVLTPAISMETRAPDSHTTICPELGFSPMLNGSFREDQSGFEHLALGNWTSLGWPQVDSWAYMDIVDLQLPF